MSKALLRSIVLVSCLALLAGVASAETYSYRVSKDQALNAVQFGNYVQGLGGIYGDQLAQATRDASRALQNNDRASYMEALQRAKQAFDQLSLDDVQRVSNFAAQMSEAYSDAQGDAVEADCEVRCVFGDCRVQNCTGTASCTCLLGVFPECSCTGGSGFVFTNQVPTLTQWGLILASLSILGAGIWLIRRRQVA